MNMPATMTKVKIEIDRTRCKECSLCVDFCNRGVLALENGFPVVVQLDRCNVCEICELMCPDFAINIVEEA